MDIHEFVSTEIDTLEDFRRYWHNKTITEGYKREMTAAEWYAELIGWCVEKGVRE